MKTYNEFDFDYFNFIETEFLKNHDGLFRFGSILDGGYLIEPNVISKSVLLISGGISSNVEFEYDIFRFNPTIEIIMIDPTISRYKLLLKGFLRLFLNKKNKLFYLANVFNFNHMLEQKRCIHEKKWLSKSNNLKQYLNKKSSILLKLDIEGAEYELLNEIIENKLKFTAIVMEFHNVDVNFKDVINFLNCCTTHFDLVSLNSNPSGGYDQFNRPKCIELSLIRNIEEC